jgi:hypothetical protein
VQIHRQGTAWRAISTSTKHRVEVPRVLRERVGLAGWISIPTPGLDCSRRGCDDCINVRHLEAKVTRAGPEVRLCACLVIRDLGYTGVWTGSDFRNALFVPPLMFLRVMIYCCFSWETEEGMRSNQRGYTEEVSIFSQISDPTRPGRLIPNICFLWIVRRRLLFWTTLVHLIIQCRQTINHVERSTASQQLPTESQ